jgi:virginiamycin A acetyltransferase
MSNGPSPDLKYPLPEHTRLVFLKNIITNPNIVVGDYTYYDDFENPENFEKNVLYHFDFIGDKLIIGKFCAIASDVRFIMNGGNHAIDGISSYPFGIFGQGWEGAMPTSWPHKGDMVVGNDVWIGYAATLMPGVQIGDGAIVASQSVVTRSVEPYTIVGGNPAREIRKRFDPAIIQDLLQIQWWHWPVEKISQNLAAIAGTDMAALRRACE